MRQQHGTRLIQVAQRGRQAPRAQRRRQAAQTRQAQLQQHTALVSQQFVPFDSNNASDSGVITSTSALPWRARRLSRALASPVRSATVQSTSSACAAWDNARVVSAASARSGVTHSTRGPAPAAPCAVAGSARASSSGPPNAASVLPLPVGVCSSPDWPSR
ncbi:hypothetical protein G6F62_013910 [Rhizopus arrhizus]|nr:hypothetical protein G6F62_013910 [Rhizopus arrhizus]